MGVMGTEAFIECCMRVIKHAPDTGNGPYAKGYANEGRRMALRGEDREVLDTQALYILNNLRGWRGEEARMVKKTLRDFASAK
jgi:hypothetical protein